MPPPTFQVWFTDTIGLIKSISEILSALATVGLLVVAFVGLRQWSAELRGRVELETARSVLKDLLEVKYAIGRCRTPVFFASEVSDREFGPHESQLETMALNEEHAYRKRMNQLTTAALKFETAAVEAEVLWGNEAVAVRNDVINLCHALSKAYTVYFPNSLRDARLGSDPHEDWVVAERRVLLVPVKNDEFGAETKEIFDKAERTFRKYLLKKHEAVKSNRAKDARA